MDIPFIVIEGRRVEPAEPKMKVWREFLKQSEYDIAKQPLDEFISSQVKLIILAFGKPELVNEETLNEHLNVSDVVPLVRKLFNWIQLLTFEKLSQAPNVEAGKA